MLSRRLPVVNGAKPCCPVPDFKGGHYKISHYFRQSNIQKFKSMQRSETEAIRTQIQPSKPKREVTYNILRGTRNLSFVLRMSLLRTFETIWILVITLECSNITASKSIRRERKEIPIELSGVNFSTHGSESECSCFDQVLSICV